MDLDKQEQIRRVLQQLAVSVRRWYAASITSSSAVGNHHPPTGTPAKAAVAVLRWLRERDAMRFISPALVTMF